MIILSRVFRPAVLRDLPSRTLASSQRAIADDQNNRQPGPAPSFVCGLGAHYPTREITYGDSRGRLEAAGKTIGGNDMRVAAHAVSPGHTIVTGNERELSRVDGLPFENWLRLYISR